MILSWAILVVSSLVILVLGGTLAVNAVYLYSTQTGRAGLDDSGTSGELPSVSILIPARNEKMNLERLLPSLLNQAYPKFEVWVYDDESTDGTAQTVRAFAGPAQNVDVRLVSGSSLPGGWIGKSWALHQLAHRANGTLFLFLDADVELVRPDTLAHIVHCYLESDGRTVLSGFTRIQGGGQLLTSLVPFFVLTMLPWPLVARTRNPSISALNGQCWMIDADAYHAVEPHRQVRATALEDVALGRLYKRDGWTPRMIDLVDDVQVYMYGCLSEAWEGFRKNAFLLVGGSAWSAAGFSLVFVGSLVVAPVIMPVLWLPVFVLKGVVDRMSGFPFWISLLAPVSIILGTAVLVDSAVQYARGEVRWKGRQVTDVAAQKT